MKIVRVVVTDLPRSCTSCFYYDTNYGDCKTLLAVNLWNEMGRKSVYIRRHDECPLVLETDLTSLKGSN